MADWLPVGSLPMVGLAAEVVALGALLELNEPRLRATWPRRREMNRRRQPARRGKRERTPPTSRSGGTR